MYRCYKRCIEYVSALSEESLFHNTMKNGTEMATAHPAQLLVCAWSIHQGNLSTFARVVAASHFTHSQKEKHPLMHAAIII